MDVRIHPRGAGPGVAATGPSGCGSPRCCTCWAGCPAYGRGDVAGRALARQQSTGTVGPRPLGMIDESGQARAGCSTDSDKKGNPRWSWIGGRHSRKEESLSRRVLVPPAESSRIAESSRCPGGGFPYRGEFPCSGAVNSPDSERAPRSRRELSAIMDTNGRPAGMASARRHGVSPQAWRQRTTTSIRAASPRLARTIFSAVCAHDLRRRTGSMPFSMRVGRVRVTGCQSQRG